jgi:hypothetical protein
MGVTAKGAEFVLIENTHKFPYKTITYINTDLNDPKATCLIMAIRTGHSDENSARYSYAPGR